MHLQTPPKKRLRLELKVPENTLTLLQLVTKLPSTARCCLGVIMLMPYLWEVGDAHSQGGRGGGGPMVSSPSV